MRDQASSLRFSLAGSRVLLTGATGFFGRYFAKALAGAGASLILVDRNRDQLDALAAEVDPSTVTAAVDLYDRIAAQIALQNIARCYSPDILVNNAWDFSQKTGFNDPSGRLEVATYDQFEASFQAGVWWAVQATQIVGSDMKRLGRGSIINICSMYATVAPSPTLYEGTEKFNPPGYSMAKAGLLQFTRYSASFLGPEVRVNAISPGAIPNTESSSPNALDMNKEAEFMQRLVDRTLLKRVGHPRDLTGPLVFLASDASSYMTGHNLIVDGGWTVV